MSKIIRTDKEGMVEAAARREQARQRLEYLDTLLPSTPAPLTDEDLAIYGMFLQQDPEKFGRFMAASHNDYVMVFYAEVGRAIDKEIERYES